MLSSFEVNRAGAEIVDDLHYGIYYYITTSDSRYLNSHYARKLRDRGLTYSKLLVDITVENRENVEIASGSRYFPNGDTCFVYLPIIFVTVDKAVIDKLKEQHEKFVQFKTVHGDFFLSRKVSLYVDLFIEELHDCINKFYCKQPGFQCWTEDDRHVF